MNQLIYLIIIFVISFILSSIYLLCIRLNIIVKILMTVLFIGIFSSICYLYNYFIFNEYVVLMVLYAIYFSCVVKMHVKKKIRTSSSHKR